MNGKISDLSFEADPSGNLTEAQQAEWFYKNREQIAEDAVEIPELPNAKGNPPPG